MHLLANISFLHKICWPQNTRILYEDSRQLMQNSLRVCKFGLQSLTEKYLWFTPLVGEICIHLENRYLYPNYVGIFMIYIYIYIHIIYIYIYISYIYIHNVCNVNIYVYYYIWYILYIIHYLLSIIYYILYILFYKLYIIYYYILCIYYILYSI